jgi:hypothetical protein
MLFPTPLPFDVVSAVYDTPSSHEGADQNRRMLPSARAVHWPGEPVAGWASKRGTFGDGIELPTSARRWIRSCKSWRGRGLGPGKLRPIRSGTCSIP